MNTAHLKWNYFEQLEDVFDELKDFFWFPDLFAGTWFKFRTYVPWLVCTSDLFLPKYPLRQIDGGMRVTVTEIYDKSENEIYIESENQINIESECEIYIESDDENYDESDVADGNCNPDARPLLDIAIKFVMPTMEL